MGEDREGTEKIDAGYKMQDARFKIKYVVSLSCILYRESCINKR